MTNKTKFYKGKINTPIGNLLLVWQRHGLVAAGFEDDLNFDCHLQAEIADVPANYKNAFKTYFAGDLDGLDEIPIAQAGSPFFLKVWRALRDIPAGETRSYQDIAVILGNPKGVRAVGMANGRNPLSIIVPCHRVIGKNGTLMGYAGGLKRKKWLLEHEGVAFKK